MKLHQRIVSLICNLLDRHVGQIGPTKTVFIKRCLTVYMAVINLSVLNLCSANECPGPPAPKNRRSFSGSSKKSLGNHLNLPQAPSILACLQPLEILNRNNDIHLHVLNSSTQFIYSMQQTALSTTRSSTATAFQSFSA